MLETNKIYLGDCLDYLKDCPKPDLIICDSPYSFVASGGGVMAKNKLMESIREIGTQNFDFNKYIQFILNTQGKNINAYFFCNKTLLPAYLNVAQKNRCSFDLLFLVKNNPLPCKNSTYVVDTEYIIFMRGKKACFNNHYDFNYYKKHYFINIGSFHPQHPNQKPIDLIRKFIKISSKENDLVLDCFMGSGTTALACQQLHRRFIGFEIVEKYVEIANKRLVEKPLSHFI